MPEQLPTAEEFFGASAAPPSSTSSPSGARLPTAEEFFGDDPAPEQPSRPDAIQGWDRSIRAGTERVLDAFGVGAKTAYGTEPLGLSPETEKQLRASGVLPDYMNAHKTFGQAVVEGLLKPLAPGLVIPAAAKAFDFVTRAGSAALAAPLQAAGQAIEETGLAPAGKLTGSEGLSGAATDPGVMMALGLHAEAPVVDLAKARSLGVIGEGEAGWKGTAEPAANTLEARSAATKEIVEKEAAQAPAAGQPDDGAVQSITAAPAPPESAPEPEPAAPDIHAIARQIDPQTFEKYDALQARHDTFNRWINELAETRAEDPKVAAANDEIQSILGKVNGVEDRLTKSQAARLDDIRGGLQDFLSVDSPDMARVREELVKNYQSMRDLAPDVASAYRQAQERLPQEAAPEVTPTETPPVAQPEAAQPVVEAQAEPMPPQEARSPAPAPQPTESASPAPANENPIKSIADDVSRKLVSAGRPQDEADASAVIVQAHYEARAERFGGAKGSPEDMYAADGADIKSVERGGPKGGAAGKAALKDGRATVTLFGKADASTFMHETGHHWLNELAHDAEDEAAPQSLKDDAAAVRKWAGAPETGEIPTRAHEKFARGFERYLMEGRAPSKALAGVFGKFRQWLTAIYQTVNKLRAPITDDIRGVFDRLITVNPEKDVIAEDGPVERSLADIHEHDAEHTPLPESAPVAENIRTEVDQVTKEKTPEHYDDLPGRADTEAGGISGEDPVLPSGGDEAGPIAGENRNAPQSGAVPARGNEAPQESGGVSTAERPARSGSKQSAEAPAGPNSKFAEPEGRYIDKAGNIRLDNINGTDDVNGVLKEFATQNNGFLAARRGVVSEAEILDYADLQGLSASDVNIDKLRAMSVEDGVPLAARILGARKMLVQSANEVHLAMQGDDALLYSEVSGRHIRIQETLSGITAEWGRAGHAFRMMGEEAGKAQELSDFLKENTGRDLFQIKREMQAGKLLDSPSKVSGFLRDARKPSLGEMVLEAFKNWLISGPQTHMMYAVGNKVFALYKAVPETAARAAVGAVHEAIAGHPIDRVYFGEVPAQLYAMFYGQRNGLKAAWDLFKAGQTVELPGEAMAAPTQFTQTRAIPNFKIGNVQIPLGSAIRIPGERMVAPIHAYDRAVGYETIKAGLIYRKAAAEGLTGDGFNARVADLAVHTPEDIMASAREETTEQALMGGTGEFTRRFSRVIRFETELPLLGRTQPLSFIEPFINIGSVINKQALIDRGPLGAISKIVRDDISGKNGVMAQDTAIAKMGLGTSVAAAAGGLVMEGFLNKSAPSDPNEAAVSLRVNGLPHSVRIGEMSYQLNRLGVIGMQLSVAADMYSVAHTAAEDDYAKAAGLLVHSVAQNFLDEGYASGISDLMRAIDDSDRYGESYVRNFFSTALVPYSVGMSQVAKSVDPYAREARTLTDAMLAKVPYFSEGLPPRRDLWGEPIPNNEFRGVYAAQTRSDPVDNELLRLGHYPARPDRKIRGVELTPQQYDDFSRIAGRLSKMRLNALVQEPGFESHPPGIRIEMITKVIAQARESARSAVMMKSPEIVQKAMDAKVARLTGSAPPTVH